MLPLRFAPYHLLGETPNVVVDGSGGESTRFTLSHWPGSPTPAEVRDDLSAQIAFHALEHPHWFDGVEVVSNNHFDQDGLCSIFTLAAPEAAQQRRDLVIDVARAGDFGTFEHRDAAHLSFVIAAYDDPATSPLGGAPFAGGYAEQTAALYDALVPTFAEMLDHPGRFRSIWQDEDAHLDESIAAIEAGVVTIEERPVIDLAIVKVPEQWAERTTHRFTQSQHASIHPMAVNQATSCLRTLVMQGTRYRLECRYETWVMLTSRMVMPRPDLRPLADRLNGAEPSGARWTANGPGALTPQLHLVAEGGSPALSGISPERFVTTVAEYLAAAPPAWDPFESR